MGLGKFVAKSAKKAVRRAYRERHPIDPITKSFVDSVDDILPDIEDGDDEKKPSIIIGIIKWLCVLLLIFGFVVFLIGFMIASIHQILHGA